MKDLIEQLIGAEPGTLEVSPLGWVVLGLLLLSLVILAGSALALLSGFPFRPHSRRHQV